MEQRVKVSLLIDLYQALLTEKQNAIMNLYFNDDLSLAEISEITNTSRQAVFDTIKRCEKSLLDYESKLNLLSKSEKLEEIKNNISKRLNTINEKSEDDVVLGLVKEVEQYLMELN